MLTLQLETALKLLDSDSLNAANGVIASVFNDPNRLEVQYEQWFSTRMEKIAPFQALSYTPHFEMQFLIMETSQPVILEYTQPEITVTVVPENTMGQVSDATPDTLTHNTPGIFSNVDAGDTVTLQATGGITAGDYAVATKIDDQTLQLSAPFFTGAGTANTTFTVTRLYGQQTGRLNSFNRLLVVFSPIIDFSVRNISQQLTNVRMLGLGT